MATDDKENTQQNDEVKTEQTTQETTETNESAAVVTDAGKLDAFLASLNDKIDSITKEYDKKLSDMKEKLDAKTAENEKLKNVNAQILMNTSVSKSDNDEIDFSSVDIDDPAVDAACAKYFGKIDSKVF